MMNIEYACSYQHTTKNIHSRLFCIGCWSSQLSLAVSGLKIYTTKVGSWASKTKFHLGFAIPFLRLIPHVFHPHVQDILRTQLGHVVRDGKDGRKQRERSWPVLLLSAKPVGIRRIGFHEHHRLGFNFSVRRHSGLRLPWLSSWHKSNSGEEEIPSSIN